MPRPTDYYATDEPCDCPACTDGQPTDTEQEGSPTWRGAKFNRVREAVLEDQSHQCADCGITDEEHRERDDLWPEGGGLHVHHRTEIWEFDNPQDAHTEDNCVALCANCHDDRHPWDIAN